MLLNLYTALLTTPAAPLPSTSISLIHKTKKYCHVGGEDLELCVVVVGVRVLFYAVDVDHEVQFREDQLVLLSFFNGEVHYEGGVLHGREVQLKVHWGHLELLLHLVVVIHCLLLFLIIIKHKKVRKQTK